MANKSVLFGGRQVKVENRSGFDKSRLHALTTGVGTITPIFKQLVIPSSGRISLNIHAELPPLATNAFLRTHLKVEAFYCPMRLCYGGFQSWFSGEQIYNHEASTFGRACNPIGFIPAKIPLDGDYVDIPSLKGVKFGPGSLSDYFGVKYAVGSDGMPSIPVGDNEYFQTEGSTIKGNYVNIYPYLVYSLIYDHFYRNKSVSRPLFAPLDFYADKDNLKEHASSLPYISQSYPFLVCLGSDLDITQVSSDERLSDLGVSMDSEMYDDLLDGGCLYKLRQRNYGDDYFTCAKPTAQEGSPVSVQTDANGRFTISSLRVQNAMQEFRENQGYATPDFIQTNMARYGVSPSDAIVQKPVLLGSADFPMFTKGVELSSNSAAADATAGSGNYRNPFSNEGILGATAGRASANGQEFVCDFDVKEPGYIMVMATLVPEANYADGIAHDMRIFTGSGDLVDLPCGLLEHVGDEPIQESELYCDFTTSLRQGIFGYVQRYLWHKAGQPNLISGLFRPGMSLQAFVPQRPFEQSPQISSSFLRIETTDLDGVAAVESGISQFGVMLDCAINCFVSEPLSESALPALSNPAIEHGRSVYLKNGGSKLA